MNRLRTLLPALLEVGGVLLVLVFLGAVWLPLVALAGGAALVGLGHELGRPRP